MKIRTKNSERGFSLMEYAFGLAILAGVVVAVMTTIGGGFNTFANGFANSVSNQASNLP